MGPFPFYNAGVHPLHQRYHGGMEVDMGLNLVRSRIPIASDKQSDLDDSLSVRLG